MLLDFKRIGEVLSLDDYNAIVYLLTKYNNLTETIILTSEGFTGDYASYFLEYDDGIVLASDYYLVTEESELLLVVNTNFVGEFKLTLSVCDEFNFDESDINFYNVDFYANKMQSRQEIVIPLSQIGVGSYISTKAKITVLYNQPIIDKDAGSIYSDSEQHLIKTSDDLLSKIETAPTNTETHYYLVPGETLPVYNLEDDQDEKNNPIIIDNKSIVLESGSTPTTLDAGELHRHFYITETGKLTLKNIELTNGNSNNDQQDTGKGGSIYIKSARRDNIKLHGNLQVENCKFTNNKASQGGAVYNKDGLVNIKNTIFYNNKSMNNNNVKGDGGAVYNEGAS